MLTRSFTLTLAFNSRLKAGLHTVIRLAPYKLPTPKPQSIWGWVDELALTLGLRAKSIRDTCQTNQSGTQNETIPLATAWIFLEIIILVKNLNISSTMSNTLRANKKAEPHPNTIPQFSPQGGSPHCHWKGPYNLPDHNPNTSTSCGPAWNGNLGLGAQ